MDLIQGLILGATIFDYWFEKAIIIIMMIIIINFYKEAIKAVKLIQESERLE